MQKNNLRSYISRLKTGERDAFDPFYEQTKGSVWFAVHAIVKDRQTAEDLMQETYISFLNHISEIDESANPLAYLVTTARNKALNELRRRKSLSNADLDELPIPDPKDSFSECDTPLLDRAKKILSEKEWRLLELCVIYGYKRVEVAKMLRMPVSTVNWQYNQLLKKLKKQCAEVYDEKESESNH